ncbi:MAG: hypothetical protein O7G85_02185 [Planctomycetota bacterium]|nr:hypothetical protein [Planctomycetota bacterium]
MVQLQDMYDRVEALDMVVIAIAQEDKDIESHGKFHDHFKPEPKFELAADFSRSETGRYERTSTYVIGKDGVIKQIYPQLIHYRAHWDAVLSEAERVLK